MYSHDKTWRQLQRKKDDRWDVMYVVGMCVAFFGFIISLMVKFS